MSASSIFCSLRKSLGHTGPEGLRHGLFRAKSEVCSGFGGAVGRRLAMSQNCHIPLTACRDNTVLTRTGAHGLPRLL